jgi:DNA-binding protein
MDDEIDNFDIEGDVEGVDNVVYVGSKPLVNYVKSVIVLFLKKNNPEIIIRSRGKFISKAVDVAEVVRRRPLMENQGQIKLKKIEIGSEEFENEGKKMNVSTMDISLILEKPQKTNESE